MKNPSPKKLKGMTARLYPFPSIENPLEPFSTVVAGGLK
jgi:hypothetical protein